MAAYNDLLKDNYIILLGFRKEIRHNVRNALGNKYWEQVKVPVFLYTTAKPRDYITNLDTWLQLDKQ